MGRFQRARINAFETIDVDRDDRRPIAILAIGERLNPARLAELMPDLLRIEEIFAQSLCALP
jgi:hypothetical protein